MSEWYNDPEFQPGGDPEWSTPEDKPQEEATAQPTDVTETTPAQTAQPQAPSAPTEPTPAYTAPTWQTPSTPTSEAPTPEPPAPPTHAPYEQPRAPYGAPRQTQQPPRTPYSPYGAPNQPYYNQYPPVKPKKKVSGAHVLIALLAVICCASLIMSGALAVKLLGNDNGDNNDRPNPPAVSDSTSDKDDDRDVNENGPTLEITDTEAIDDGGLATSEIVKRNVDATVVLTMYTKGYNSFYGFYYGEDSGDLTEAGGASGIIMSADGYIITNSHCVYDEESQTKYDRIDVTLYDGREFQNAEVVGYDPTTDLAVIKINATDLTPAEFGDSSALSLGDRVVTLGNSGGLAWTVSQGILSGQARDVYEDTGYAIKCLQVDAIINPGSSGGPLINAYGQVVGVNSAKIVMSGYEGLGFSIPINEAKDVIDDLIKYGYVTGRVSLGIMGRTITSIGYEGFMIESIGEKSALVGTKAQAGDIITHVNGKRVTDYAEMRAELTSHKVGDTVKLTLLRLDRQTRTTTEFDITVTLQESR